MYKKNFNIFIFFSLFLLTGLLINKYFIKSWTPYYQKTLYKNPRALLIQALDFFKNDDFDTKQALDLGAGAGNDTAYLLQNGWKVWANDAEKKAIEVINFRKDIQPFMHNVILIHKSFSELPWSDLPKFDLIFAGYSLPFATQSEFKQIWTHIIHALRPGGIFAGHFFGPDEGLFNWWQKYNMTLFTKEELLNLFKDVRIEYFKEINEKNEYGVWDHSFEVILKRV